MYNRAKEWLAAHITTTSTPFPPPPILPSISRSRYSTASSRTATPLLSAANSGGEGSIAQFEQSLRSGYTLAHLARSLAPSLALGGIFSHPELQFRHTDNINQFFTFLSFVGLPEIFRFETLDLYNAKDLPKVVFCIHALSHLLDKGEGLGKGGMRNLVGRVEFTGQSLSVLSLSFSLDFSSAWNGTDDSGLGWNTEEEVEAKQLDLNLANLRMPNFNGIGKAFSNASPPSPPLVPEVLESEQDRESASFL